MTAQTDIGAKLRSRLRVFFVLLIAAWSLGYVLPALAFLLQPTYDTDVAIDFDGVVQWVAPRSAAAAAGLEPGDQLELRKADLPTRLALFLTIGTPGVTHTVSILHRGKPVSVALRASPDRLAGVDAVFFLLRELASIVIVALGAWLVLVRPSRMTWGFYFYCAFGSLISIGMGHQFFGFLPPDWRLFLTVFWDVLVALAPIGFLIFAMRFPRDGPAGWRRIVDRYAGLLFAGLAALSVHADIANVVYGLPTQREYNAVDALGHGAIYLFAAASLFGMLMGARGSDRQRLKWVVAGLTIGFGGYFVGIILVDRVIPGLNAPSWAIRAFFLLNLFVPPTVAYAVVRHHVIDVRYAISRTLVLGVLTSFIIAIFAATDWLIGKELASIRLAIAAEIVVAIALGFWLDTLHRNLDRAVANVLFRRRRMAERRLAKLADSLLGADSRTALHRRLVHEPAEILELASAALFCRDEQGRYVRDTHVGWEDGHAVALEPHDPLVQLAQSKRAPVHLYDVAGGRVDVPHSPAPLALGLPIGGRDRIVAMALYGPHRSGATLDPDEIRAVAGLAANAAAAYDHLEAEALRAQTELLSSRLDALSRQIQTLKEAREF